MRISDLSSDVCSSDLLMSVSTRKHTAPAGGKVAAVAVASLFAATALAGSALAQEVKIGLVGGISGPIAALAPPMIQASKLAVEHVNAQGGLLGGKKLVAVVGDSACSQQGGTDAAAKVVNVAQVIAMVCPFFSAAKIGRASVGKTCA